MRRFAITLFAGLVIAGTAGAQPKPAEQSLRVFVPPPLQWNQRTQTARSALQQTPHDLARINADLTFGMTPEQVAALFPVLPPDLSWTTLRTAPEYPADVRYVWVRLRDLPQWRDQLSGCFGSTSYVAFLFNQHALFRVSFRLIPDAACPSVTEAALDLFARYVPVGPDIALSVRYSSPPAEVVDITDPTATLLLPVRWRMGGT